MPAVCSLRLPVDTVIEQAWFGVNSTEWGTLVRAFTDFDGRHLGRFPPRAQLLKSLVSTNSTTRAIRLPPSGRRSTVVRRAAAPTRVGASNHSRRWPARRRAFVGIARLNAEEGAPPFVGRLREPGGNVGRPRWPAKSTQESASVGCDSADCAISVVISRDRRRAPLCLPS